MKQGRLKLCVITGSRAEYGLMLPLMKLIKKDQSLQLQIIATGMHLSDEFGNTWKEIEKDGFAITEKVKISLTDDSGPGIAKSTGKAMMGIADALEHLKPDWVILLGDRFETFAAAAAAHLLKIPIAHLHGGELTQGAVDDAFRHAITKMAMLHFTSAAEYRNRVIQLGESPKRVFNVGAIGIDNIKGLSLLSTETLEKDLGIDVGNAILVTFHPVTLENRSSEEQFSELLGALEKFPDQSIIFTLPNADADGRIITKMINEFVAKHPGRCKAFASLGQLRYLSLLQYVKAMVGNSSSGIIEAPSFALPVVNIGSRQDGRIRAKSVIDVPVNKKKIEIAVQKALSGTFRESIRNLKNPYGTGNSAPEVLKQIKKFGKRNNTVKEFFDLRHA